MNCNCHEVLGGEADDAGVDTDSDVDGGAGAQSRRISGNVELIVDHKATIVRTFAVVVRVQVGCLAKVAVSIAEKLSRCNEGSVIAEHQTATVEIGNLTEHASIAAH